MNSWKKGITKGCILVIAALVAFALESCQSFDNRYTDAAWWREQAQYDDTTAAPFDDIIRISRYIPMRDGVNIAVDCYLPEGLKQDEKIPAILVYTRYGRALEYNWPFNGFLHGRYDHLIEEVVRHGYAWVYADARGSGASSGTRLYPYSSTEIDDGEEIVDWIISREWSSGRVGTWGSSYAAGNALHLLRKNHPAVQAAMPTFTMFDMYAELFPGGIVQEWFIRKWDSFCMLIDSDSVQKMGGIAPKLAVKGIRPVDGDHDLSMLKTAVEEHVENGSIWDLVSQVECRDDEVSLFPGATIDYISPFTYIDEINQSGAAVYLYTGWFDSSFINGAINCYNNLEVPYKKLTIGPWSHGGWHNISPYAPSRATSFDKKAEIIRFFDCYLKDRRNGIETELPVHYFTMGEAKWKSSDRWPPEGFDDVRYYFREGNSLSVSPPSSENEGFDEYRADFTASTGNRSRWNSLFNIHRDFIYYPDRRVRDKKLFCYTTAPFRSSVEITGHPVITLYLGSSAADGNIFIYLEDVAPNGRVTYITEGLFRTIHRETTSSPPPYSRAGPYHSFRREDERDVFPGEVEELVFDLYPTSYLLMKGHSLRVAIAGADSDHFPSYPEEEPLLRFYRSKAYPSRIMLPVIQRDL